MQIKIAINGFGRIGRISSRIISDNFPDLQIVAVNDLADEKTCRHLLKYDSSYGGWQKADDFSARFLQVKDPLSLPWKDLAVDVVLECSGIFIDQEGSEKHLKAGAKKVVISAPAKSDEIPVYLLGVNENQYNSEKDHIVSMGSCTTNCLAPIVKILDEQFGIESGFMTTTHSYTNDQKILDQSHKDLRRARTAGLNIIPTTTGATKTVEKCLPNLKGKLNGISLRVPTSVVSIVDFVCQLKKETTAEKINEIFVNLSEGQLKGILSFSGEPLVSVDFKGNPSSAIVDGLSTQAIGKLIKILAWYDNEWGYCQRLAEFAGFISQKL